MSDKHTVPYQPQYKQKVAQYNLELLLTELNTQSLQDFLTFTNSDNGEVHIRFGDRLIRYWTGTGTVIDSGKTPKKHHWFMPPEEFISYVNKETHLYRGFNI